ncbi:hypothetical protein FEM48_Zijuj04G0009100 [Ziziphus jujuba var. spinosa]|uniref:Uncharacterized protein n=1 Tax=Ziziphus jujuba var. spinosa TaxID=714518 RepID=A0A978VGW8_ZIZJJ|nr:hypothetical protein FEM48_Zijuj04G0009100 [Ziziphus jujuba var. spinosa]
MASTMSFVSAVCLGQPVSYDRCDTNSWPHICLRIGSKPNSLMAKSLRLNPNHEFAHGFPRFPLFVVPCKPNSPLAPSPSPKYKVRKDELAGLLRQAKAMSSADTWVQMENIEPLMKANILNYGASDGGYTDESISCVFSIEAAKAKGEQSWDLAEKLVLDRFGSFTDSFVFSKAKAGGGVHAFRPMLKAIDKFINCHPPPILKSQKTALDILDVNVAAILMSNSTTIQYKNENGEADVEVKYLILAFAQDERFGKKFMKDFQIPHPTLTFLKTKKITAGPEYEIFDLEEMEEEI